MAKNLVNRNTAQDLRTAYLIAFDNFATEPVEVGNAVNGNSRYGRELLGTLVAAGLIMDDHHVNGTDQVWQCVDTYDNVSRETAEATIDAFLATLADEAPVKAKKAVVTNLTGCLCGCGELANKDRDYRPGHDARHAGNVGREIAARRLGSPDEAIDDLLLALPSSSLRIKAKGVALKALEGKKTRSKVAKDQREVGTVKLGRWVYPAMRDAKGEVTRNAQRDGKGAWVSAPAESFRPRAK